jgi:SPP1 gp7 family putative phage head morphogenesis protein
VITLLERKRRALRRARAPREPRGPAAAYVRAIGSVLAQTHREIATKLRPIVEREFPSAGKDLPSGLTSEPDAPDAVVGRLDACAVCGTSAPPWYARAAAYIPGDARARADGMLDTPFAVALGELVVALGRIVAQGPIAPLVDAQGKRIGEWNRREMHRVLGIDLGRQETGLGAFIDSFRRTNVRLIQSIPYSEIDRIEKILAAAVANGTRVEVVWREIERTFEVSRSRAKLIARDQTLKANADVSQLRQQNTGVTHYFWISSRDERVRGRPGGLWEKAQSDHWILDGTRQDWIHAPVTNRVKGFRNHPGKDYQCRCIASPDVEALLGD